MSLKWLARTRNFEILGPLGSEEIEELINQGKLVDADEICQANGFWFSLDEKVLVERYFLNEEKQTFNPVTEAPDILVNESSFKLTSPGKSEIKPKIDEEEIPEAGSDNNKSFDEDTNTIIQKVVEIENYEGGLELELESIDPKNEKSQKEKSKAEEDKLVDIADILGDRQTKTTKKKSKKKHRKKAKK